MNINSGMKYSYVNKYKNTIELDVPSKSRMSVAEFDAFVNAGRCPVVQNPFPIPIVLVEGHKIGKHKKESEYNRADSLNQKLIRTVHDSIMGSGRTFIESLRSLAVDFVARHLARDTLTAVSHNVCAYMISEIMGFPKLKLGEAFYRVSQMYYYPIAWKGRFPEGYCLAYRPPDHPWPTLPKQCVPTREQIKEGTRKPTHPKPTSVPIPTVPVTRPDGWSSLVQGSPSEAVQQWLSPWCESSTCEEVLAALAARVDGVVIRRSALCLHARNAFDRGVTVRCAAPWSKELVPMPRSAAELIRRHNGITISEDGRDDERDVVFRWNGKRFAFPTWKETWTPDRMDPGEPFMKPPLAPLYLDDHNVWVFHPHRLRGADDLELCRVRESRTVGRALPFGLPAAVLRLLAYVLVPEDQRLGQQFGLGFLTRGETPDDRFGLGSDSA
jgi:hypothetical protein